MSAVGLIARYRIALWSGAFVLALLAIFQHTAAFTVGTWIENETYTHGFIILPISLWLMWQRRHELAALTPQPTPWLLLPMLALGLLWELGYLGRVMVVQQYSLVGMIIVVIWGLLGTRIARVLAFPLGFLMLAVPFGEAFLPPMMEFTADFTVAALKLTGIPVYREGNYFTIPSGNWSVVEACSGIRYLISSVTLGLLYAYLTYRSLKRRMVFVVLAVIVPIIANGFRAYMIVMIGHLSDMKYAVGVDHLLYGWVFFGVVMLILFWIGSYWREDGDEAPISSAAAPAAAQTLTPAFWVLGFALLAVAGGWRAYGVMQDAALKGAPPVVLPSVVPGQGWVPHAAPLTEWQPHFQNPVAVLNQTFAHDTNAAMLYLGYYRNQTQEQELIRSQNVLVSTLEKSWNHVAERTRQISFGGKKIAVRESELRGPNQRLLVWHWYWVGGVMTANDYRAKWQEASRRLLGRGDHAAVIILAAPYQDNPAEAARVLTEFAAAVDAPVHDTLSQAADRHER